MMAAAVATSPVGGAGATNGGSAAATTSRFAAACGALSQYVRAAETERAQAAAAPLRALLPLMPGADADATTSSSSSPDGGKDHDEAAEAHQMTIVYGGRVLVLDGVPAGKAAGLLRLVAAAAAAGQGGTATEVAAAADLPVARKASLQRFMEKRRVRVAARAAEPYRRPDACPDHLKLKL